MSEYKLYCFAQSGNAYKAALMLQLCEADWSAEFVDYFNGATKTEAYRVINEMGEVPVLEHKGERITQSGVILDYLSTQFGKYGGETDNERREILRWLLWDNHKLTSFIATYRYMINFMKTGETPVTEFNKGRFLVSLKILNNHLEQKRYVIGEHITIADMSLCGYLFWPDEFGVDWADYPHIERWLKAIQSEKHWVHPYELMPGYSADQNFPKV
ncbi:MAG: glutathione S-transferase family protein [Methyloligellaceae bacterium]